MVGWIRRAFCGVIHRKQALISGLRAHNNLRHATLQYAVTLKPQKMFLRSHQRAH